MDTPGSSDDLPAPIETGVVPFVQRTWEEQKAASAGPGGKFDADRRRWYLELRIAGRPHLTALRTIDISSSTYDRYSAAVGAPWQAQVRAAREESLDPIREVRREAALAREPWAVDREIGKGRDRGGEEDPQAGKNGTTVNVGVVGGAVGVGISVEGGAQGVDTALDSVLARLRERKAEAVESGG